jgi:hypothetical protein
MFYRNKNYMQSHSTRYDYLSKSHISKDNCARKKSKRNHVTPRQKTLITKFFVHHAKPQIQPTTTINYSLSHKLTIPTDGDSWSSDSYTHAQNRTSSGTTLYTTSQQERLLSNQIPPSMTTYTHRPSSAFPLENKPKSLLAQPCGNPFNVPRRIVNSNLYRYFKSSSSNNDSSKQITELDSQKLTGRNSSHPYIGVNIGLSTSVTMGKRLQDEELPPSTVDK